MTIKEIQEKIVENMRRWQKIENATVSATGNIIEITDNPIIRLVMEIIQRDSQMHHRIQELVAESLESKTIFLTPEELGGVWELIEKHIEMEKETVQVAKDSLALLKGKKMVVQEYLIDYLRLDEQKHDLILESLATIKEGMYPYG
jgi:hypothetical protein